LLLAPVSTRASGTITRRTSSAGIWPLLASQRSDRLSIVASVVTPPIAVVSMASSSAASRGHPV
jgi:hypothetical protein